MLPDTALRWMPRLASAPRVAAALLLGSLTLGCAAAEVPGEAPAMDSVTSSLGVHSATDALEEQAARP